MSVLATREPLLHKIFVSSKNSEKGIYTLKFYKDGKWVYLHIDDRIPLNRQGAPMFAHGNDKNETWCMLMEKAYAKLHGCFENLTSGWVDYGLRDLTGGAPMKIKFSDKKFRKMLQIGGGKSIFELLKRLK